MKAAGKIKAPSYRGKVELSPDMYASIGLLHSSYGVGFGDKNKAVGVENLLKAQVLGLKAIETGRERIAIDELIKETLKDLLALRDAQGSLRTIAENLPQQGKTLLAEYYREANRSTILRRIPKEAAAFALILEGHPVEPSGGEGAGAGGGGPRTVVTAATKEKSSPGEKENVRSPLLRSDSGSDSDGGGRSVWGR